MKNKTLYSLYTIFLLFICFSIFFLRWFNDSYVLNCFGLLSLIILVVYFSFYTQKNLIKKYRKEMISLIVLLLYIVINTLIFRTQKYYFANLYLYLVVPISYLILFRMIFDETKFVEKYIINKGWKFVNAFQILNGILLILQIIFKGFIVRDLYSNAYYDDNITGLLGSGGTHRLAFSFLIAIYMDYIVYNKSKGQKKKVAKYFMIFITIFSIVISYFNDNKFYFILLLLFYVPIIIDAFKRTKNKKKILNISVALFSCFLVGIIVLIIIKKDMLAYFLTYGDERINLFRYAIEKSNIFIGKGIGSIEFLYDKNMPKHFGMCELTSRIYTGGIIYLILIVNVYINTFMYYFNKKSSKLRIYLIVCFALLSYYTMLFSHVDISILTTFLFLMLCYMLKGKRKDYNE